MKNKGFTLIEIISVIIIIGVIMVIAVPSVSSYITNARKDTFIVSLTTANAFVSVPVTVVFPSETAVTSSSFLTVTVNPDISEVKVSITLYSSPTSARIGFFN